MSPNTEHKRLSQRIIICDDSITNVAMLKHLLEHDGFTNIVTFTDPRGVLPSIQKDGCDLLLLDLEMPHINGFVVAAQVRTSLPDDYIPILILTGMKGIEIRNKALDSGANDFVNKPFDQTEVLLRVKNLLEVRNSYKIQKQTNRELEEKVQQRTKELNDATEVLIQRLALAGELRDNETGNHIIRVSRYSRLLADAYGIPPDVSYMIEKGAPMHDIGKIGIPDSILLKNGRLTDEEMTIMKTHPEIGGRLLGEHSSLVVQLSKSIAMTHHEKWDGSGYPNGLSGEDIPVEGRIVALADVFDALTTKRPYKNAWPVEDAVTLINEQSGIHFEPKLVDVFNGSFDKIIEIKEAYSD